MTHKDRDPQIIEIDVTCTWTDRLADLVATWLSNDRVGIITVPDYSAEGKTPDRQCPLLNGDTWASVNFSADRSFRPSVPVVAIHRKPTVLVFFLTQQDYTCQVAVRASLWARSRPRERTGLLGELLVAKGSPSGPKTSTDKAWEDEAALRTETIGCLTDNAASILWELGFPLEPPGQPLPHAGCSTRRHWILGYRTAAWRDVAYDDCQWTARDCCS